MNKTDFILSSTDLHALFEYKDGDLFWKVAAGGPKNGGGSRKPGDLAGTKHPNGYKSVRINNVMVKQHRVIFMMFFNRLPQVIDHIDGDPSNNKIENLREASASENVWNAKKGATNKSGVKGVCWHKRKNKWIASCAIYKRIRHVGYFDDVTKAAEAVIAFRQQMHGAFANHG